VCAGSGAMAGACIGSRWGSLVAWGGLGAVTGPCSGRFWVGALDGGA